MTRIDIALAPQPSGKAGTKTAGKDDAKDGKAGDFKSLMLWRLGAKGDDGKSAKPGATEITKPGAKHAGKDGDKADKPGTDPLEALLPPDTTVTVPTDTAEPPIAWDAILGTTPAPATIADTPLPTGKESAAPKPSVQAVKAAVDSANIPVLPTDNDLSLVVGDASTPPTDGGEVKDPFAVLSSMIKGDKAAEPAEDSVDIAAPKMSVITRETHFAPVARLTPVQQVATVVGKELAATEIAAPAPEPAVRHASSGPLKVLHVKLEPEDLGTVVVKMRMVDQSLELELVAQKRETAELLEKDKEALTRVLRASGYAPDAVTVTATTTTSDSGSSGRPGGQSQPQTGGQPGGSMTGNGSAAGGDDGSSRSPRQIFRAEETIHEDVGSGRARGDLYL